MRQRKRERKRNNFHSKIANASSASGVILHFLSLNSHDAHPTTLSRDLKVKTLKNLDPRPGAQSAFVQSLAPALCLYFCVCFLPVLISV